MKCLSNENNIQTLKLLVTAEVSNVKLEVELVDVADPRLQQPKHLPVILLPDGSQLFSSNQSCIYLAKPHSTQASSINQWLEWESVKLYPSILSFIDNPKSLSDSLKNALHVLEETLKNSPSSFLVETSTSIADICVWTSLYPLLSDNKVRSTLSSYSHIVSWYDSIAKLPQVQKALQVWTSVAKGSPGLGSANFARALSSLSLSSDNTVLHSLNQLAASSKKSKPVQNGGKGKPEQGESKPAAVLEDDLSAKCKEVTSEEVEEARLAWCEATPEPLRKRTAPVLPQPNENNILITSALPYVNNVPHLGNIIGCVLSADVFSRFCRLAGRTCLFVCGTDEYGTATETRALAEATSPRLICDKYFSLHRDVYAWFHIDFDHFGRTSAPEQTEIVQALFHRVHEAGYTSTASVDQLHCGSCDRFLADRFVEGVCPRCRFPDARGDQCDGCGQLINATELIEPRCKVCAQPPTVRSSTQLFLELPKIEPQLREWVEATSGAWSANARLIARAWLKEGLRARCITRDLQWGVPVPLPGFEHKVFYVWFDAPIGYLSLTQAYCGDYAAWWRRRRPADGSRVTLYQFMAKDNVPFHAIMFPATLVAAGDEWIKVNHIMATEYLNYEDGKFSKSRGTGVFGNNARDTGLPADIFRFYLLYVRPEGQDTSFSWQDLATKTNSELLNNLGNFVNRALTFVEKNYAGAVPPTAPAHDDWLLLALINREAGAYFSALDGARLRAGLRHILRIARYANQYMQARQPWVLCKGEPEQRTRAATALGLLCQVCYLLSLLLHPYMPATAAAIQTQLGAAHLQYGLGAKPRLLRFMPPGHKIGTPAPLFRKIEQAQVEEWKLKFGGRQEKTGEEPAAPAPAPASYSSVGELETAVAAQGNLVRQLKSGGAQKSEWQPQVEQLLRLKKQLDVMRTQSPAALSDAANSDPAPCTETLEAEIAKQAELVRRLKASAAGDKSLWAADLAKLLSLKQALAAAAGSNGPQPAASKKKQKK